MKDYVTHVTDHPHSLTNYFLYSQLSVSYEDYISKMSTEVEPKNYEEVVKDHMWVQAMKHEIAALEDNE